MPHASSRGGLLGTVVMAGDPPPTKRGSKCCPWFVVVGLLLLAGLGLTVWLARRGDPAGIIPPATAPSQTTDPRPAHAGPDRNIGPGVHYLRDSTCVDSPGKIYHSSR